MGRFFNDRNSGRRSSGRSERPTMHRAVCDKCGNDCEVPFKPSGEKPIYCSRCFETMGNTSSNRDRGSYRDFGSRDRGNFRDSGRKEMFSAVCDKCGEECEVPFKPSSDKPIYCSRCFETVGNRREDRGSQNRSSSNNTAEISQLKEQLGSISAKLDKLLKILTPVEIEVKEVEKKATKKATTKAKAEPKKKAATKKKVTKKE